MGLQSSAGSQVQFRFEKCCNLRRKNGSAPNAAVYAQYTTKAGQTVKSPKTAFCKSANPEWFENSRKFVDVNNDTEIAFVVLDSAIPRLSRASKPLARSSSYSLGELLQMRDEALTKGVENGHASPSFAIPLDLASGEVTAGAEEGPSLILSVIHIMSEKEKAEHLAKVTDDWRSKQRDNLDGERAALAKELQLLGDSIPSTANAKILVDLAAGLFASISPLLDNNDILEDKDLVLHLITSYRVMLEQFLSGKAKTPELRVQYYGKGCLEMSQSLRVLERCLRKPELLKDSLIVTDIKRRTIRFETFPQEPGSPLGNINQVFSERETLRNALITESDLFAELSTSFSAEPTRLNLAHSPNPSPTVQMLTSWALLSSRAELKRLFWLHGAANCGKTQLAHSLIDVFGRMGVATAYFTFNNHSPSSSDEDADGGDEPPSLEDMTKAIAFQLAAYVKGLASSVSSGVLQSSGKNADPLDFPALFKRLVISPLQVHAQSRKKLPLNETESRPAHSIMQAPDPVVIILDDLDQCAPGQLEELLLVLKESLGDMPKEVRVLMFSRELGAVRGVVRRCAGASMAGFGEGSAGVGVAGLAGLDLGIDEDGVEGGMGSAPGTPGRVNSIKWGGDLKGDLKGKRRSDGSQSSRTRFV
ncbi:hypothetical protein DFP72DRAFT_880125 [Ephemerocybe angulata]|uniref:Nephrocystin 3-like N-terminal domain-containing protein n=1 Tax=Ephemerocybe angulata TaxID=980116 RepID=A0A8H6IC58_9AGAR|nr:hypothetical protein DFP72DRAFT_880125 [Tulosesus angulatus]